MKFQTRITSKELFQFLMKHSYAGFHGKIGLVISLAAAVLFVMKIPDCSGNESAMVIFRPDRPIIYSYSAAFFVDESEAAEDS